MPQYVTVSSTTSYGSDSTTTWTVPQYVDNPTLDLFNGLILFFVATIFVIWFFRKRS